MGDIADMMLDGTLDSMTGEYLGEGPGYPRSMDPESPDYVGRRERDPNRKMNPVFGVQNYLKGKGVTDFAPVLTQYQTEVLKLPGEPTQKEICEVISKDFGAFVKWYGKKAKKKQ